VTELLRIKVVSQRQPIWNLIVNTGSSSTADRVPDTTCTLGIIRLHPSIVRSTSEK